MNETDNSSASFSLQETIQTFLKRESASGIILMGVTLLALIVANSPLRGYYNDLWNIPVAIQFGNLTIAKHLLLWINDGLMAVFFLLVGLELKREIMEGELAEVKKAMLPTFGAIGGMMVPALIYVWINKGDPEALRGWAIPAATDIAFALGVLSLLGKRVPLALKTFLVSLAIIDDVGAIVIIAIFYTEQINMHALIISSFLIGALVILNKRRVRNLVIFSMVGMLLWIAVLKSGVHATLAGVIFAFCIPLKTKRKNNSPARRLEHDLHTPVAYFILPVFAFANAGVALDAFSLDSIFLPIPLGIFLGLFLGKQIGVFFFSLLAVKLKLAEKPSGVTWVHIYGIATLCGIGFTMSLFISGLAFDPATNIAQLDRVGIFIGSFTSALMGYLILKFTLPKQPATE